ncbi:zinc-ribbon domain-containing protein [Halomicronema sp. CCY15110]|uniref:zinc-ribbon domain-containing protein n=1 Tax=Halomicronema sp. CCY15110 TaxID=2767773 RepID=UPI00194ED4BB|nr:zinc-ribbon domain-containing protein [Halomicronema sp. CCY15110]
MAYTCELGSGQRLYLENVGEQTAVTLASGSAGQQQQSGSQFPTGTWTAPPELFRTQQGVVIQLTTAQGTHHLQLQGNQLGVMSQSPALGNAQQMQMSSGVAMPGNAMPPMQPMGATQPMPPMSPMQPMEPMQPMQPMQPMKMGNMEMNANPMQMRMGNMAMQMGNAASSSAASSNTASSGAASPGKAKFCSQCGTAVQPSDRFCANCGHQLNG